ncbi:uncharacterized protein ARMOST_17650 [Armillaria ostoyae]|uniref:Uncharacterized protein n=1 Tax=Armillaria ostoyae TaxID=47428 RepID=A0A284RZK1_ARMOS|nr:uncharacterized protein ARMOST_17650 [Armillaria ostoyae]
MIPSIQSLLGNTRDRSFSSRMMTAAISSKTSVWETCTAFKKPSLGNLYQKLTLSAAFIFWRTTEVLDACIHLGRRTRFSSSFVPGRFDLLSLGDDALCTSLPLLLSSVSNITMSFVLCKLPCTVTRVLDSDDCPPNDGTEYVAGNFPTYYDPLYYPAMHPDLFCSSSRICEWLRVCFQRESL